MFNYLCKQNKMDVSLSEHLAQITPGTLLLRPIAEKDAITSMLFVLLVHVSFSYHMVG